METDAVRLSDRAKIYDALCRNARGVDRRDWELLRSAYHADAQDDHGDYCGGIDGLIAHLEERHASIPQSMHQLHAVAVEFADAATAVVESQFTVIQTSDQRAGTRREAAPGGFAAPGANPIVHIHGRYADLFQCREGLWRIARRTVIVEQIFSPAAPPLPQGTWKSARRDGNDPIELLRREFNLR